MSISYKKRLDKIYKKRLKALNKTFFSNSKQGIILFEEYLKYLRDCIIISKSDLAAEDIKIKIATITAATAELKAWGNTEIESKKDFHWNNFCELLKPNMKEWLALNDSI